MKNKCFSKLLLLFLLLKPFSGISQDIDFYLKGENDKFKYPAIYEQMSVNEFKLLSRKLRMQDMLYAIVVPGYVHFQIREYETAYALLTIRLAGYAAVGYIAFDASKYLDSGSWFDFSKYKDVPELRDKAEIYSATFVTGIAFIFGSYFFDWIHGRYRLQHKQDLIRYKYSMKLKLNSSIITLPDNTKTAIPVFGLNLRF
jgi:hypothetical protein